MPPRRTPTERTYAVVSTFHYPDGVALTGDRVTLDEEWAQRGLASGALMETDAPKNPAETPDAAASKTEE